MNFVIVSSTFVWGIVELKNHYQKNLQSLIVNL